MITAPPYFLRVVSCANNCPTVQNRNTDPELESRFLPRGTTSRALPGNVKLMVIATNPGQPQLQEDETYYETLGQDLANAAWNFTANTLEGNTGFSPTLDPLISEVAFLLDCKETKVLDHAVFTNHVKCSTPKSYSSYKSNERQIISQACISLHLKNEISFWRPQRIAVFSATARDAMKRENIGFDGYIAHPTALGLNRRAEYRKLKLVELKGRLNMPNG